MTPEGYTQLTEALKSAGIPAEVTPQPQYGEDVRFVDVRTNQEPSLSALLNALGSAGLMEPESSSNRESDAIPRGPLAPPQLRHVSSEVRTIAGSDPRPPLRAAARVSTFEDTTATQRPVHRP